MALLSADSFTRTNSTSVVGSTDGAGTKDPLTWATENGTCGINSNQAYASAVASASGVGNVGGASVNLATADVDISLTFATIGSGAAILFRFSSMIDYWIFASLGSSSYLYKVVSGTLTGPLGSGPYAGAADGDVMRVVTNGSIIRLYRNGTLLDTITDSHNSTVTHHGYMVFGTNARLDSWSASSLGPQLSTDTFNRTNSTTTLGSTDGAGTLDPLAWTANVGTCGISSNQAYASALDSIDGRTKAMATVNLGAADFDVSITLAVGPSTAASNGLVFRFVDHANYWWWREGGSVAGLFKCVTGTLTQVGSGTGSPADGDVFRVVVNGSSINAYRNGALIETTTDSTHSTATKVGFHAESTSARFDTFTASSAGAASQNVATNLLTVTPTVSNPAVTGGASTQTVNANLLTVAATVSNPSVVSMRQTVNTNLLSATATFFTPTVTIASGAIGVPLLNAAATFYAPSVGQPTVVVPATPPQYVLKVVDIYGASPLTLASAIPDEITWTLNEPAEASFSFPKPAYTEAQLPTLATASDVREIQIYRDGDLLFWGPMIQPGAAGSRGDVQCHCADPLWVLDRRNIDAPRVNLVDNPSFEDDFTGWINNGGVTATVSTTRKILGTHSARLQSSTAGGDTHLRSHFSVFPTPRGVILTVVGWFWLESITSPAFASIGLMLEGGQSHAVERNNYYAIDTATPTGRWTRAEFELITQPRETWDCTLKIFCPQGVIYWDALAVVANDGTGTNEEEWDIARTAGFLVNHVQSTTFGKSHYNVGTNTANNGVTLQRNYLYSVHTSFSDALAEFADRNDGFDYSCKITPTTRQFTTHTPKKGTDRSTTVTLTFGGNVADYRWSRDGGGAITRATETSDSGEGGVRAREEGEYVDASQMGGLILQEVRSAPPEVELNSLLPLATERVNKRGTPPLVLELDILPSAGLIHTLAVGDTVTVHIDDGYVQVSGARRIVRQTLHCRTNVLTVFVNEETD